MSRRIIHDKDFIQYVMTPPVMDRIEYEMYEPKTSQIRVIENGGGESSRLGQLPSMVPTQNVWGGSEWVMPVVIIVVSAMAFMTLYMVLTRK